MARDEGMWRIKRSVEECGEWEGEGMTQMVQEGCQEGKERHTVCPIPPTGETVSRLLWAASSKALPCFVGWVNAASRSLGSASSEPCISC